MNDKCMASFQICKGGGKRLEYNDLCKALGMLLIIWGHIKVNDWTNAFVYAFHIPLFFALSGMVFQRSKYPTLRVFLRKKASSLLLPYIVFSFITWAVWATFSFLTHTKVESYWMPLAETFIAQGSGGFLVHNVPLWFVTCLFVMELIYYFLSRLSKLNVVVLAVVMAGVSYALINYCNIFDVTLLPWNIEVALLGIPFFAAGNLAVEKWGHEKMVDYVKTHKALFCILICLLAIVVAIGSRYNGSISFGHAFLGKNVFVAYGCAFCGVVMMLALCMLLSVLRVNKYLNWLRWFGRNSFYVMAIHNPIKGVIVVVLGFLFHIGTMVVSDSYLYSFIAFLLTITATVICLPLISWVKHCFSK